MAYEINFIMIAPRNIWSYPYYCHPTPPHPTHPAPEKNEKKWKKEKKSRVICFAQISGFRFNHLFPVP